MRKVRKGWLAAIIAGILVLAAFGVTNAQDADQRAKRNGNWHVYVLDGMNISSFAMRLDGTVNGTGISHDWVDPIVDDELDTERVFFLPDAEEQSQHPAGTRFFFWRENMQLVRKYEVTGPAYVVGDQGKIVEANISAPTYIYNPFFFGSSAVLGSDFECCWSKDKIGERGSKPLVYRDQLKRVPVTPADYAELKRMLF